MYPILFCFLYFAIVFDATDSYRLIFSVFVFTNVAAVFLVLLARAPKHSLFATTERPR